MECPAEAGAASTAAASTAAAASSSAVGSEEISETASMSLAYVLPNAWREEKKKREKKSEK